MINLPNVLILWSCLSVITNSEIDIVQSVGLNIQFSSYVSFRSFSLRVYNFHCFGRFVFILSLSWNQWDQIDWVDRNYLQMGCSSLPASFYTSVFLIQQFNKLDQERKLAV